MSWEDTLKKMSNDLERIRENFRTSLSRRYRMEKATNAKIGIDTYEDFLIEQVIKKHLLQFSHMDYDKLLEQYEERLQ